MWTSRELREQHRTQWIKDWFEDPDALSLPAVHLLSYLETIINVDEWWEMILEMLDLAPNDRCVLSVAAGPLENLLSLHGEEVIDIVENEALRNSKLKRALAGVFRLAMTDAVWDRVKKYRLARPGDGREQQSTESCDSPT